MKWGENWRLPTFNEINELLDNCTTEWTTLNRAKGYKFTSNINGNSIFLPAGGERYETLTGTPEYTAHYWSGTLGDLHMAYGLGFSYSLVGGISSTRYHGYMVRPIWKE